tara:strand:- start:2718 stop:3164 length:447 start_codon:yes stop_codon:yes gene_type:complete
MKNLFSKFFKKDEITDDQPIDKVISACISLMIEVSIADQFIEKSEIESLKKTLSEKFNIEQSEISSLIAKGKETQEESTSLYEFTRIINDDFSFEEKYDLIKSMWQIAFADGNIDKYEEYVIRKVSDLIYISHEDFIKAKMEVKNESI